MTAALKNDAALNLIDAEADEVPPPQPQVSKSAIGRFLLGPIDIQDSQISC